MTRFVPPLPSLLLVIAVLVSVIPAGLWAQSFPDRISTEISDHADLLNPAEEAQLTQSLAELRQDTGIEMTVVTLFRQDSYAPDIPFETFATGLFNHWALGDAQANDGILVLVMRTDQTMRIELGAGFDPAWDATAQAVIDDSFLPAFRNEDYAGGLLNGTQQTIERIARPFAARAPAPPPPTKDREGISLFWILGPLIGMVAMAIGIPIGARRLRKCPRCNARGGLRRSRVTNQPATRTRTGSATDTVHCTKCDYRVVTPVTLAVIAERSASSSSGSGGSSGGGSSSGGGASGSW